MSNRKQVLQEILHQTLIGEEIEVLDSKIWSQIGLKGTIVAETTNYFVILTKTKEEKKVFKSNIRFKIKLNGENLEVDGTALSKSNLISRIKKMK